VELLCNQLESGVITVICSDVSFVFSELFRDYEFIEAAGGLVKQGDSYLIIRRLGKWDIPKGKMEIGETPEQAAIREIEEECGIRSPRIVVKLTETYHTYAFKGKDVLKRTHWFLLDYSGNELLVPQVDEQITAVKWVQNAELAAIRQDTFGSIIDVLDALEKHVTA
jgi:8-oxo-dGTP pyrophosphatase MutT (NUDIX family)